MEQQQQNETCCICLEPMSHKLAALRCGHVFHEVCIKTCIKKAPFSAPKCPLCKWYARIVTPLYFDSRNPERDHQQALKKKNAELTELQVLVKKLETELEAAKLALEQEQQIPRLSEQSPYCPFGQKAIISPSLQFVSEVTPEMFRFGNQAGEPVRFGEQQGECFRFGESQQPLRSFRVEGLEQFPPSINATFQFGAQTFPQVHFSVYQFSQPNGGNYRMNFTEDEDSDL